MRIAVFAILLAATLPVAQAAEDKRAPTKPTPAPKQSSGNPCAAYGPGFVQVEGGSTCVRLGGALEVGVGGSSRR